MKDAALKNMRVQTCIHANDWAHLPNSWKAAHSAVAKFEPPSHIHVSTFFV